MKRLYDSIVKDHLDSFEEMLFLSGPRQVGKTTVCQNIDSYCSRFIYLNWDNENHRQLILSGPASLMDYVGTYELSETKPVIVFDELHKRPEWKNFLKGFFDIYKNDVRIIVTGSSRLDTYKQGGDSLMGRYFSYRMHPLSVGECLHTTLRSSEIISPSKIKDADFEALFHFGGFPKPFIQRQPQFSSRWKNLRRQQLVQEDIRDVNVIHDLNGLKTLMDMLKHNASKQIIYSNLAKLIRVSADTIARWIEVLESFYYCYRIKPWSKNISRSLIKEPKIFLWDWSLVEDPGSRAENFIAAHLLKATQYWTDCGFGEYDLFYLRTLEKKEVDFLVSKNGKAWFLVEVKLTKDRALSPNLISFQEEAQAAHAFQVVLDMPFVKKNCFEVNQPTIVPARTFLSQLV